MNDPRPETLDREALEHICDLDFGYWPERAQAVVSGLRNLLLAAEQRAEEAVRERDKLRALVIEAYPGEHPTNGWRMRAEKLNAWPGAPHKAAEEEK